MREQLKSEKEKTNQLEQQLKQEQSKPPKVIEKEIDNTDYHKIDELQGKIKKYDNESQFINIVLVSISVLLVIVKALFNI